MSKWESRQLSRMHYCMRILGRFVAWKGHQDRWALLADHFSWLREKWGGAPVARKKMVFLKPVENMYWDKYEGNESEEYS